MFQQPVDGGAFAPGLPPQTSLAAASLTSPDATARREQYQSRGGGGGGGGGGGHNGRESLMAPTVSFQDPDKTPPPEHPVSPPVPKPESTPPPNGAPSAPAPSKPAPKNAAVYQDGAYWKFLVFNIYNCFERC